MNVIPCCHCHTLGSQGSATTLHTPCALSVFGVRRGVTFPMNGAIPCVSTVPGPIDQIPIQLFRLPATQYSGLLGTRVLLAMFNSLLPQLKKKIIHFHSTASLGNFSTHFWQCSGAQKVLDPGYIPVSSLARPYPAAESSKA